VVTVVMSSLMTSAEPNGFGYTEASMGGIFVGIASCILFSSLVFAKWLDRHTHPQQRVVCLGIATLTTTSALAVVMVAWEEGGLWAHGDVVLIIGLIVNFVSTIGLLAVSLCVCVSER